MALSDDRGGRGEPPRFYTIQIEDVAGGISNIDVTNVTELRRPDGTLFPSDAPTVDPEAVRILPNGNLLVSSEGNFSTEPAELFQPFVWEIAPDGSFVRAFTIPEGYNYVDDATEGARNNRLFEALAVTPSGDVFVGNEGPLIQDGEPSTATTTSFVRLAQLDGTTGLPLAQFAYELPAIPLDGAAGTPGLTDLLALSETEFLALERSFAGGVGNTVQVTYASLDGATDTLGLDGLLGEDVTPVMREVLLQITDPFEFVDNDNLEALAFGPILPNGNPSLIIAADNNFNDQFQRNLFLAFELAPTTTASIPLPGGAVLLLSALGVLTLRCLRK